MKVSKKLWKQIESAIEEAAWDKAEETIPNLRERPPDDWNDDEKREFDHAHDVSYRIRTKIKAILEVPE
jgi:hypothetical protein